MKTIEFNQITAFLSVGVELYDRRLIPGIFTKKRVSLALCPEGLYKYELRNATSIEKSVVVDFTGTLFTCIELPSNDEGVVNFKDRFELETISYERWRRIQGDYDFGAVIPVELTDETITPFVTKKLMQGYKVVKYPGSKVNKLCACPKCSSSYFFSFTRLNENLSECPFCHHKQQSTEIRFLSVVKVDFADGDHLTTRINTDFEGAKEYYLGKVFNVGCGENDNMQKCTNITLLETILPNPEIKNALKGVSITEGEHQALILYERYRKRYYNPLEKLEENLTLFLKDTQKVKRLMDFVRKTIST